MEKTTQTEQDYLNLKLLILECKEGMSLITEDNETVSNFLADLASKAFEDVCGYFFKSDDDKIDRIESLLLKWLQEFSQDKTRLDELKKEVQDNPIY